MSGAALQWPCEWIVNSDESGRMPLLLRWSGSYRPLPAAAPGRRGQATFLAALFECFAEFVAHHAGFRSTAIQAIARSFHTVLGREGAPFSAGTIASAASSLSVPFASAGRAISR